MRVVFDIEANGLKNPTKIWVIVCREIVDNGSSPGRSVDTPQPVTHIFRKITDDEEEKKKFLDFASHVDLWIGHNILGYDCSVLASLCSLEIPIQNTIDTLVISKLVDASRKSHSIESYGLEFNIPKINFTDFSKYSEEMETYCVRDVEICHRIYDKHFSEGASTGWKLNEPSWHRAIDCEQRFQRVVNDLHNNGFSFNRDKAERLLSKVTSELNILDANISSQFPPREVVVRYFTPRATKYGTINRTSVPRSLWHEIENYKIGEEYPLYKLQEFNPSSHKQVIDVLCDAGWAPVDKTDTHIEALRNKDQEKIDKLVKYGYKINENNLGTLSPKAPLPARTLAKRILLESRRRTLTEWLGLVATDGRIHGKFLGIGAWTHRMAHQEPNTANIPNDTDQQGKLRLYGGEMRALWRAEPSSLLVGVDAESIQLRVFAHYVDDPELTHAIISGRKEDKTDPHSVNKAVIGSICKTRTAAKRLIYSVFFGAGLGKISEILDCTREAAAEALNRLMLKYPGWALLKQKKIQKDGARGYFEGLDGRLVRIPGDTASERRHIALSGYLQNGEVVIMKMATILWMDRLREKNIPFKLVNMVHDEWQTECPGSMNIALAIADEQCKALREVGEILKLKCPLAGSYETDGKLTIGDNWKVTH